MLQYEWLGVGVGGELTHFSSGPAPNTPNIKWQKSVPGVGSDPVAFNGMLFITIGSNVIALDPETGEQIYKVTVSPAVTDRTCSVATPMKIDNKYMLVISSTGSVVNQTSALPAAWAFRCLNIADGSLVWNGPTQINCVTPNRPTYVPDTKMIYMGVSNDTGSGGTQNPGAVQAWSYPNPTTPPTLAWTYIGFCTVRTVNYGDGRLFVGSAETHLTCLDAVSGQELWVTLLPGAPSYVGSYYNGVLYRGCLDNTFVAIEGSTGKILWQNKPSPWGFWCSGTAIAYGMVYEPNVDGYFYALNITTGAVVWKYLGPGQYYPGYAEVADGKVYVCSGQGVPSPLTGQGLSEFTCFNAYTGEVIWQVSKEFRSGPTDYQAIAYGNFYAINQETENGLSTYNSPAPRVLDTILYCYGDSAGSKDWLMFGGDPAHTATGKVAPLNMGAKWVFTTSGSVLSSPAVVQGKVYIGSDDKNWYCLNAETGAKIWSFATGYYIRSSPAVVNGKFYSGTDDGFVYCLDANTGAQLWKTATPGKVSPVMTSTYPEWHSSPNVANGKVYVGSADCKFYCLDANSGNILWTIPTSGAILSTPTVDGDGVYFASVNGFVYKVNPTTGSIIWNASTPIGLEMAMEGSPCIGNGMVVIGSGGARNTPAGRGQMYCLNASTGARLWTYSQQNYNTTRPNLQMIWSALYLQHATLGPVFYFGDFYHFTCVNATDGKLIWTTYLTREHFGLPAYADNKIYIPADTFGIYVCDATTGAKLGYFEAGAQVRSSPAIYNGKVYFGSNNFNVYCVGYSSAGTTYYPQSAPSPSPAPSVTSTPPPTAPATAPPTSAPTSPPTASPTVAPSSTPPPSVAPEPEAAPNTNIYIISAAVAVVVVVVIAAAVFLRRRK
ncbi:MAG: PQQ-binding-like beta-propeller repeat protein [Candidatus Bathyarchaeia archaeon]